MRTEDLSPRFQDLDAWSSLEAVHAMFEGQLSAVAAVRSALPAKSSRTKQNVSDRALAALRRSFEQQRLPE
jgi:N-acetylmuramic acid 6-phosphate etherase